MSEKLPIPAHPLWTTGFILILLPLILGNCTAMDNSSSGDREFPMTRTFLAATIAVPATITPTPFQPLHPTPLVTSSMKMTAQPIEQDSPVESPFDFYGIDFSRAGKRIRIRIIPKDRRVNTGKPIIISFLPGEKCNYGDQHACVSTYQSISKNRVIFITTHSGVGGEAEEFRYAIEGMGLNRSGFSLARVHANLRALNGAEVIISQAGFKIKKLKLVAAGRVPATRIDRYFSVPIERALETAANLDPALQEFATPDQLQLVFETCGWKMPEEPWAKSVTSTTGSVYLGVIQIKP